MPAPVSAKSSTSGKTRSSRRSSNLPINFEFNNSTSSAIIRVVEIDGEPWFVAADVLRTLGSYLRSNGDINTSHIKRFLNDDEYRIPPNQIGGRTPLMVSESGLYKLIMRSDKPIAREFQNWVTKVVLPSIRKDAGYIMGEEKVAKGEMSEDEMILKTKGLTWERWLKDNCPISRRRADWVIAVADGRIDLNEAREADAQRKREARAEAETRSDVQPDPSEKRNDFNDGPSKEQSSAKTEPESDLVKEAEGVS